MRPRRLETVLRSLLKQRWPAFIWGPPGIGKSSIVHAVAKQQKLPVVDLRASLLDPTDLRGIPSIVDGRAVWCPPSFLPQPGSKPGILFLDEINAAPPLVQAGMYQLVLDRRVGEYELPKGWWIVAAGNRQQDRAVTFRMSSALANRFVHLELETDVEDWRSWAIANQVDPLIISFLALRPKLLWEEPNTSTAYPTPRSWEMVSDVIAQFQGHGKCADLIPGIVGPGAATELAAFVKRKMSEEEILRIVADPENAELPTSLDGIYVLTSWLATRARDDASARAAALLLTRLPPEFATVLARDMLKGRPGFAREPGYRQFVRDHGNLIAG